jgi:adenylate cyclase
MSLEIERKFIVAEGWRRPADAKGVRLCQAYLTGPGAPVEIRVRAGDATPVLTAKSLNKASGAMVRQEVEFEIAPEVFDQLWELSGGASLSKVRWTIPLDRHTAVVDEYDGALAGLRVVEVEFDSIEEATAFQPPNWFGKEATGNPIWSNRELAAKARAVPEEQGKRR